MRLFRSKSHVRSFGFDSSSLYMRLFRSEPLASLDLRQLFIVLDSIHPLSMKLYRSELPLQSLVAVHPLPMRLFRFESRVHFLDLIQPPSLCDCLDSNRWSILLDLIHPLSLYDCLYMNRLFILLDLIHLLSMTLFRSESLAYYFAFDFILSLSPDVPRDAS
jgi:hypothetical protein